MYARRSVPNRNKRISPVSVLAALIFRGAEDHAWGPAPPSWYAKHYWDRPHGQAPRETVRTPARYATRIPEQLRDPHNTLKVPEWEAIKAIAGGT